jgi:hypothetical protein
LGADESWSSIGKASVTGQGQWTLEDRSVTPGKRTTYRLRVAAPQMELVTGEISLDVPAVMPLAIRTVFAKGGRLHFAGSIPSKGLLQFEIFDVQGRRLLKDGRAFDHSGEVNIDWPLPEGVSKSVYFARVTFGGQSKTRQLVMRRL